ncbi:PQ loop repeat protein [Zopfia rhizophila CBS 207.26]|uniref:PQ loop repeat protein n=1 Tax=Zopfia rhizophila CBS 207.26 TaxID=1314779 RepID=A0A6A6EK42_9PEZI|nr:PQ loop repeat protein [Zopfia rhizophila CBS 207.26]
MGFLNAAVTSIAPIFIATSPITSYADQIYSIHRTRSSAGFSLDIPLIMLVASILKVYYWFGAHFSTSLLLQALLMITIHLLLLHVALSNRPSTYQPFAHSMSAPRPYNFWQWRSPRPYWTFLSYFTLTLLLLHFLLSPNEMFIPYTSLLGYVALAIEATLPLPQLLSNYQRRGCKGFRVSVIINWIIGDTFKMWFFFASDSDSVPLGFKVCGVFQALCDLGLGAQFWIWGDGPEDVEGKAVFSPPPVENGFGMSEKGGYGIGMGEKGVGVAVDIPMEAWERR